MVKLFCAVVGVAGSAFRVDIDASQLVGDLKKVIKGKNPATITCDAKDLRLFLAKAEKGAGAWLTENDLNEGVSDTSDLKLLGAAGAPLNLVGLSEKDVKFVPTLEDVEPMNTPVHVLVVVPEGATSEHDSWALFQEINVRQMRLEMQLEQLVASLPHKPSNSYSNASLGQLELRRLEKDQLIIEVAPIGDGEAFWSEETQIKADAITDETDFDAFITPYFSDILHSCGMVFVNSERYEWLSQSAVVIKNKDLKPDGFATHRGMFRGKPLPNDGVPRPSGFRFGVAEDELFDCLILFESKLTITETAFGQVARYLQNLLPEAPASAILFDRRSFWLIKSHKSVVVKVQIAKWTNNGSKSLFRNFITDNVSPWVSLLTLACSCLGVDVVEGDAFLGRGAHGRVYKVIRREGEVFALKLVEKCSVGHLYQEKKALTRAQHTGLTTSLVGEVITPEGAALLLSPVGEPLPRPRTQQEVRSLFELLWQLHANNLVHGDPRVPNVNSSRRKTSLD